MKHPKSAAVARYRKKHPETYAKIRRNWLLRRMYGLSPEAYEILQQTQKGLCAICRQPSTMMRRGKLVPLSVDHDHRTGRIRGLLCSPCNTGLGQFADSVDRLRAAIDYLALRQ